jgi:hypothetical protein
VIPPGFWAAIIATLHQRNTIGVSRRDQALLIAMARIVAGQGSCLRRHSDGYQFARCPGHNGRIHRDARLNFSQKRSNEEFWRVSAAP